MSDAEKSDPKKTVRPNQSEDKHEKDRPEDHKRVRDAGTGQMQNPPEDWDEIDEEVDESFPASDPPANY